MKLTSIAAGALLLHGAHARAADLPTGTPADMSLSRLERITNVFKADTESKRLPGAGRIVRPRWRRQREGR